MKAYADSAEKLQSNGEASILKSNRPGYNTFYHKTSTSNGAAASTFAAVANNLRESVDSNRKKEDKQRADSMGRVHTSINNHIGSAAALSDVNTKLMKPDASLIRKLLNEEKDDRYRYLLKNGNLHHIEPESYNLFVELPQIPNILIVYRRPIERS